MDFKKAEIIFSIGFIVSVAIAFFSPSLASTLLGLWLMIYAAWHLNTISELKKSGIRADGYIVSYEKDRDGDDVPIFEFTTITKEIVTGKALNQSSLYKKRFPPSKQFLIIYKLHNPSEFIVDSQHATFSINNTMLVVVALVFFIIGVLSLLHIITPANGSFFKYTSPAIVTPDQVITGFPVPCISAYLPAKQGLIRSSLFAA